MQFFLGAPAATGFQLCYVDVKVSGGKYSASAHADALSLAKKKKQPVNLAELLGLTLIDSGM